MSRDLHLNVLLPKNRNNLGWIRLDLDGIPRREFRILGRGSTKDHGKATGNPTLSPFRYAGNTPTGDYISTSTVSTTGWNRGSYGPWGAIRLKAVAGDALLAQEVFGRDNLLIHGGAPGGPLFQGYRSTLGCLRLSNTDMKQLIELISNAGDNASALMCEVVSIRITVRE